jgi:hypothetical protein
VNCDDLGSSRSANVATLHALMRGIATSATLMVPCPWAFEAASMFQDLPVGVHLTLTSEYPRYRWRGLTRGASLHDADGFLPATTAAALAQIEASDARAECQAQVETALSWGVDVTHLDAHMDVMLSRADLSEIYLDLAQHFRLPVRMMPSDAELRDSQTREQAHARGILCPDRIIYPWPRRTAAVLLDEIPRLQPGVTETFVHPVQDGPELRAYDTSNADIRVHDAECAVDPAIADLLDRHRIKRISFRELRELQRAA